MQDWNKFYEKHGRFYLNPHPGLTQFIDQLKQNQANKVLDLGCGNGRHLVALAEEGFSVNGVDFSPAAVDLAQKWLQEKGLEGRASIADLHEEIKFFKDAEFDAILAIDSLHFESSDEYLETLKEINRLLKTGGLLFLVVPSKQTPEDLRFKQFYFNKEALIHSLEDLFEIIDIYQDEEKKFVVIAKEK